LLTFYDFRGSKTSLNFDNFKNLIGTFYPPEDVYIHTSFIRTQKKKDYFSGLGEIAKLHVIRRKYHK